MFPMLGAIRLSVNNRFSPAIFYVLGTLPSFSISNLFFLLQNAGQCWGPYGVEQYWEGNNSVLCFKHHLKFVKIKGFAGESSDMGFANILFECCGA